MTASETGRKPRTTRSAPASSPGKTASPKPADAPGSPEPLPLADDTGPDLNGSEAPNEPPGRGGCAGCADRAALEESDLRQWQWIGVALGVGIGALALAAWIWLQSRRGGED